MFIDKEIKHGEVNIRLLTYDSFNLNTIHSDLLPEEIEKTASFKSTKRKLEYAASRYLRTLIFGKKKIDFHPHGSPFIEDYNVSISHTANRVGIAYSKTFIVGLDLEEINHKAIIVSNKFLSTHEKQSLNTSSSEEITKVWSLKEVLYKMADRKGIIFSHDLLISKINESNWKGILCDTNHKPQKSVSLKTLKEGDTIISFNTEAPQNV